jgi:hypothetical protein
MNTRSISTIVTCVLAILLLPATAGAHAFLDHADPKVGSTVVASPTQVSCWFDAEIEPDFCTLTVSDSTGKEVDAQDAHVDKVDHKLLIVSVPTLPPGKYKVAWTVVATDTHKTNGDFTFTIAGK